MYVFKTKKKIMHFGNKLYDEMSLNFILYVDRKFLNDLHLFDSWLFADMLY